APPLLLGSEGETGTPDRRSGTEPETCGMGGKGPRFTREVEGRGREACRKWLVVAGPRAHRKQGKEGPHGRCRQDLLPRRLDHPAEPTRRRQPGRGGVPRRLPP